MIDLEKELMAYTFVEAADGCSIELVSTMSSSHVRNGLWPYVLNMLILVSHFGDSGLSLTQSCFQPLSQNSFRSSLFCTKTQKSLFGIFFCLLNLDVYSIFIC